MSLMRAMMLIVLSAMTAPAADPPAAGPRLADLDWMVGSWSRESRRGTLRENWTRLSETTWEGRACLVPKEGGACVPIEDLLLVEMGGGIFYIPKVAENDYPVPFRLTRLEGRSVEFENPEHDFPTKISYTLTEDGTLLAAIDGPGDDGEPRRIEFRFRRP